MTLIPLTVSFRGVARSDALEAEIRDRVVWLQQFHPRLLGCRVLVEVPHRHQQGGRPFHVRIVLTVPDIPPIVISRQPTLHAAAIDTNAATHHKRTSILGAEHDAFVVVHEAFDAARRRLQDLARTQRGDIKTHDWQPS